ncbi:mannosyltransferase [Lacinutrix sp. C3R15]|uniref:mannosyltransferase n=1 Tax=Flavobacteriaceae TaxID=49546 RepID=UPI001C08665B|nr:MULTISPECIES: mannosyltransferase [Flavobacteriaceae]MBU2939138.1 mannosyltransferase [Lacinutrix sp. C3R15]MDO6622454.1 mannosyltransferase [Oceanihabitans sp. 1_MG-2023]
MLYNTFFLKLKKPSLLLALACILFYFSFAYNLVRTDYIKLITLYVALFFLFYKLVNNNKNNLSFLTWIAFLFRAIFILAIPNLSQDFYRFIWDGRMILEGFNPYLYTPESFLTNNQFPVAQAETLYAGMGTLNGSHFTNYPPLNQFCFVLAGIFAGKSILGSAIVLRILIIAADFGTLYFGKKLLEKLKLPGHNIFWYLLNPFIIIELTGNLHFEGVMIFFLVWSVYLLHIGKWKQAAVVFAASVSVKLIPLLFLPLLFKYFKKPTSSSIAVEKSYFSKETSSKINLTKLAAFYALIGGTTLLLFLPFYASTFITNYTQTVALWFQNFEFNASIYYLARAIGYWFTGYNEIAIIGKILPVLVILFVLYMAFLKKNTTTTQLIHSMLFVFAFYLFMSTTIHPWYISTLLVLSVFTNYKFPLVWSCAIILSYLAYIQIDKADKSENLYIIALEYIIIFSVFLYELVKRKSIEN